MFRLGAVVLLLLLSGCSPNINTSENLRRLVSDIDIRQQEMNREVRGIINTYCDFIPPGLRSDWRKSINDGKNSVYIVCAGDEQAFLQQIYDKLVEKGMIKKQ